MKWLNILAALPAVAKIIEALKAMFLGYIDARAERKKRKRAEKRLAIVVKLENSQTDEDRQKLLVALSNLESN